MIEETVSIITSNEGKYREYKKKLSEHYCEVEMKNIDYPEIQTDELEEVVKFVLDELSDHAPLIIDDSGLFIEPLKGFPGVYSSYVMETLGCDGVLSLMDGREERDARFECVIGFLGEERKLFKGKSAGKITREKRGSGGFGYDPIFEPHGYERTYAELSSEEKNEISHRGRAMEKFLDFIGSR